MSEQPPEKLVTRKELTQKPQVMIWAAIVAVALVGIGLIAWLIITVDGGGGNPPTPTRRSEVLPTPTRIIVTIQGIKSQAKLSTVEYNTVAEIYRENPPEGWISGLLGTEEKLLMLVYGDVQAGFDLEKLKEDSLWTDGTRVRLVLPAAEILNTDIDFEHTHIVYYDNGFLTQNNPDLQREALEEAEKAIRQAALNNGVLDKANDYGKLYFENFLRSLGFINVEVITNAQVLEK